MSNDPWLTEISPADIEAAQQRKAAREALIAKQAAEIAALQARVAELEGALDDLLRCTEKHVFGDECKAQRDKARAALKGKKDE